MSKCDKLIDILRDSISTLIGTCWKKDELLSADDVPDTNIQEWILEFKNGEKIRIRIVKTPI